MGKGWSQGCYVHKTLAMIPLDINTAHFRWDRLEAVTIELAVLVLLSGRKERKRRHNDNMRKTDKTSINILILCLTMDGN